MDKIDVPSLNRKSREAESRTATARRKPWAPPSKLDAPPAPPGYKHRWIRAEANGYDDTPEASKEPRREKEDEPNEHEFSRNDPRQSETDTRET